MDDGVSRDDRPIVNVDVAPQKNAVNEYNVVVETAIVGHMAVGHQQVVVPDARHMFFLFRPTVDGHPLAKGVSVTDFDARGRTCVAVVLGFGPDDAIRKETVVDPDRGMPRQDDMAVEPASIADLHMRTNHAKGPHVDVVAEFGLGIDLRERRDEGGHVPILFFV